MAANVANEMRRTVRAAQQRVERELETIQAAPFVVDAAENCAQSHGRRVAAIAHRRRVDAAHRRDRCDVFGHVAPWQRDPTALGVQGPCCP